MAEILYSKQLQEKIENRLISDNKLLIGKGIKPYLAIFVFGKEKDDLTYAKSIIKKFNTLGISVMSVSMGQNLDVDKERFSYINNDKNVHGIIIIGQVPIKYEKIINTLNPYKDVDCYLPVNLYKIYSDEGPRLFPCTALSVIEILKYNEIVLTGKNILVIGRSNIVGKPIAMMLLSSDATVTITHSQTEKLDELIKNNEIIISSVGIPKFLNGESFKQSQVVIDVGINYYGGKICGDVDFETASKKDIKITPVPGGVGPITTLMLAKQVIEIALETIK